LTIGHDKQRALLLLDIAAGHLAAGRIEGAFELATRTLETGVLYRSGRIVERAGWCGAPWHCRLRRRSCGTSTSACMTRTVRPISRTGAEYRFIRTPIWL
jgi:hypothetical protein